MHKQNIIKIHHAKIKRLPIICILSLLFLCSLQNTSNAGDFYWPLRNTKTETNPIYYRDSSMSPGYHTGWDLTSANPNDSFVYAISDGVVRDVKYDSKAGYTIIIEHTLTQELVLDDLALENGTKQESVNFGKRIYSKYLHLAEGTLLVSINDKVSGGMPIAIMGDTGNSSEQHLHFAIGNSQESPSKSYASLFTAEGNKINTYKTADGQKDWSSFKEFSSSEHKSFNCIAGTKGKITKNTLVAFSPNFIFGNYTTEDVKNPVNTIDIAKQKYAKETQQGRDKRYAAGRNSYVIDRILPIGLHSSAARYMNGSFNPTQLTTSAKKVAGSKKEDYLDGNYVNDTTGENLPQTLYNKDLDSDYDYNSNYEKLMKEQEDAEKNKNNYVNSKIETEEVYDFGTDYDKLFGVMDVVKEYALIIAGILIYIGIIMIGIGLIIKRNNPEERSQVIGALFTLGIGALTIGLADLIMKLLESIL